MNNQNEQTAAALEQTGQFRVLRKLRPRVGTGGWSIPKLQTKRGLVLDLETTGLDPRTDEIIEIGAVPFTFTDDGTIVDVSPPLCRLRQPLKPIPEQITKLTGITNEMVEAQVIDPDEIAAVLASVNWIICHGSKFDRLFAERLHPGFATRPWACSMTQVPWSEQKGFEGLKLRYLLTAAGLFRDSHRALDDCYAVLELLCRPLGETGRTALSHLVEAAAKTTVRIWAVGAPFHKKDVLRTRSYRWNDGDDGRPRAWFFDVDEDALDSEIAFLRAEIFGSPWEPVTTRITAFDRFSDRV